MDAHDGSMVRTPQPPHPLKQPFRSVGGTPVCRFHNYRYPCRKGESCEFNHSHCHICLDRGHVALECHIYQDKAAFSKFKKQFTLKNTRPQDYTKKTVLGDALWWETSIQTDDDLQLKRCKHHKRWEADKLLKLPLGSVFVDVGAHYGDTIVTMALWARSQGRDDLRFVAIEPSTAKCEWIETAAAKNNIEITIIQACVGDQMQFVEPSGTSKQALQGNLVYRPSESGVQMITLGPARPHPTWFPSS